MPVLSPLSVFKFASVDRRSATGVGGLGNRSKRRNFSQHSSGSRSRSGGAEARRPRMGCAPSQDALHLGQLTPAGERRRRAVLCVLLPWCARLCWRASGSLASGVRAQPPSRWRRCVSPALDQPSSGGFVGAEIDAIHEAKRITSVFSFVGSLCIVTCYFAFPVRGCAAQSGARSLQPRACPLPRMHPLLDGAHCVVCHACVHACGLASRRRQAHLGTLN